MSKVSGILLYRAKALTNAGGAIQETYDCDAYGNTIAYSADGVDDEWFTDDDVTTDDPTCQFIFTGRRFDPETSNATTQIYFYRARYYSPQLGRFLSRDPIGYDGVMNLYEYVGSGPVVVTDSSGTAGNNAIEQAYEKQKRRAWKIRVGAEKAALRRLRAQGYDETALSAGGEPAVQAYWAEIKEAEDAYRRTIANIGECCGEERFNPFTHACCGQKVYKIEPGRCCAGNKERGSWGYVVRNWELLAATPEGYGVKNAYDCVKWIWSHQRGGRWGHRAKQGVATGVGLVTGLAVPAVVGVVLAEMLGHVHLYLWCDAPGGCWPERPKPHK